MKTCLILCFVLVPALVLADNLPAREGHVAAPGPAPKTSGGSNPAPSSSSGSKPVAAPAPKPVVAAATPANTNGKKSCGSGLKDALPHGCTYCVTDNMFMKCDDGQWTSPKSCPASTPKCTGGKKAGDCTGQCKA